MLSIFEERSGQRIAPFFEIYDDIVSFSPGVIDQNIYVLLSNPPTFFQMLGFNDLKFKGNSFQEVITASRLADFDTTLHLVFTYSDIVAGHLVGDSMASLLRVTPLRKSKNEQLSNFSFTKLNYYPLRRNRIVTISIMLRDENGDKIIFEAGRVNLTFHFRKQKLYKES